MAEWSRASWLAEAHAWINNALAEQNIVLTGEITQPHVRPWSTVLQVPTSVGMLYFKATNDAFAHEPALTVFLAESTPDLIPGVYKIDPEKRFLLLGDAGVPLRSYTQTPRDLSNWTPIIQRYADMQINLIDKAEHLLNLGVFDRRLAVLPDQLAAVLTDQEAIILDVEDCLSTADYERLLAYLPRFRDHCEALSSFGIPETLHHDDFHDNNIFLKDGRFRFADWGEACVAHPFFTLMITLRGPEFRLNLAPNDPALEDLRNTYLTRWHAYGTPGELRRAFDLAQPIAMACRALTWYHFIRTGLAGEEDLDAVSGWLLECLTHMPD